MVDQELIDRYDAAWNEQDVDAIMAFHPDDVVFHNHNAGECVEGAAAMREHVAGIFAKYPDMRFSRRRLYLGADFATSEWTASATLPDGRRAEWDGVDVFPLRDGKLARKDVYSTSGSPRILA
jgi:taurine dehydrogenase small subunit